MNAENTPAQSPQNDVGTPAGYNTMFRPTPNEIRR